MALLAVAGLGSIGRRHASVALRAGHQVIAFDPAPATDADPWTAAASFEALLDAAPAAVVVATPDALHARQAVAALERGIPVLIEKPLAASVAEGREIAAAAAATGTVALVGYVLRYNAALLEAERLLRAGEVGRPLSFHVRLGAYETLVRARNRFDGTPAHGGIYGDYSHEWDYLDWLLGPIARGLAVERTAPEPERVQPPNVVDGLLELEGGCAGTFHLDYVQDPPRRTLSVLGSAATLEVDVPAGTILLQPHGEAPREPRRFAQPRDALFDAQLAHLLRAAAGEEPVRVPVADGLRALAVAHGLRDGAAGGGWVDLSGAGSEAGSESDQQMKFGLQQAEHPV
jgi:D-apiose dehydrogenase